MACTIVYILMAVLDYGTSTSIYLTSHRIVISTKESYCISNILPILVLVDMTQAS